MTESFYKRVIARAFIVAVLVAIAVTGVGSARAADANGPLYADRTLGKADAPVKIYEYFSLTCPHCAKFYADTFPRLKAEYIDTGKVLFVSRDFPFDKPGLLAAQMARCVPPDRYFPLVDLLFKGQEQWALASDPQAALQPLGRFAGMSAAQLEACFANKDLETFIVTEVQTAKDKYQVASTPTFIFNDGADRIDGSLPYEKFKVAIDALLAKQKS